MARSISEIATMVIGVLGMGWRLILCKLWHRVGIVVTTEAATTPGKSGSKPRSIEVVLVDRNKGMKGTISSGVFVNMRDFRFGSKGLLEARSCSTRRVSDGGS